MQSPTPESHSDPSSVHFYFPQKCFFERPLSFTIASTKTRMKYGREEGYSVISLGYALGGKHTFVTRP